MQVRIDKSGNDRPLAQTDVADVPVVQRPDVRVGPDLDNASVLHGQGLRHPILWVHVRMRPSLRIRSRLMAFPF